MELSQRDGLFAGEMWREMMDRAQGAQSQEIIEAPEQTPFLLCPSALLSQSFLTRPGACAPAAS